MVIMSLSNILVLAATSGASGGDWLSALLQGGPFAIVVLLIILDKLTTPGERDKLRTENEQLRGEIKELNNNIRQEIVPTLVTINTLMKEVVEELSISKRVGRNAK